MKPFLYILLSFLPLGLPALEEEFTGHQLSGNLQEYPYVEIAPPTQSPVPEGYEPFHLEHYGRHGSRWLIGPEDYEVPVINLEKAEKAGKLTPLGLTTLNVLREIQKQSKGRLGELSDKGAIQHQAIGKRMAQNYPEIFNSDAQLTAKSTTVIRCIISMANALEGIMSVAPGLHFDKDASQADMWFMNFDDKPAWVVKDSASKVYLDPYRNSLAGNSSYLSRLVTDPEFARNSVEPGLLPRMYWVLGNTQSHTGQPWLLEDVFSREELIQNWKAGNASWFLHGGNSELTKGRMPFVQRNLLNRIISQTDSAISKGQAGANLRFGHDGILVSIITLMELGGYGDQINSFEELEKTEWRDFDIIPMAGNLQLVFYRPKGKTEGLADEDILVKALINEREVSMPGKPVESHYYKWSELKNYYQQKLKGFAAG